MSALFGDLIGQPLAVDLLSAALGQGRRKQINSEGLADQIPKQRAQARCS